MEAFGGKAVADDADIDWIGRHDGYLCYDFLCWVFRGVLKAQLGVGEVGMDEVRCRPSSREETVPAPLFHRGA